MSNTSTIPNPTAGAQAAEILKDGETRAYHENVIAHLRKCAAETAEEIRDLENDLRAAERNCSRLLKRLEEAESDYKAAQGEEEV